MLYPTFHYIALNIKIIVRIDLLSSKNKSPSTPKNKNNKFCSKTKIWGKEKPFFNVH